MDDGAPAADAVKLFHMLSESDQARIQQYLLTSPDGQRIRENVREILSVERQIPISVYDIRAAAMARTQTACVPCVAIGGVLVVVVLAAIAGSLFGCKETGKNLCYSPLHP